MKKCAFLEFLASFLWILQEKNPRFTAELFLKNFYLLKDEWIATTEIPST